MMNKKLRIGIIGGGINSAVGYAHFSAINLSNKYEIFCGSFSRKDEINIETGRIYGVLPNHLYNDYQSMIISEKNYIDLVVILTPTNQHYEQILFCIEHNLPIICEKSLTTNYDEIEKIKLLNKNNFLSVVFNYLSYPMVKELKEIINRGDLGKILQIQIEMQQEGFLRLKNNEPLKPQSWRLIDGKVPTISLDLGTHVYSLVKFLTNEIPIEVISVENNFGNFENVIDDINYMIKYSNGVICNCWISKTALGNRNGLRIRVYGTKGSSEWFQSEPEYLKMADNTGKLYTVDRSSDISTISKENRYNRFKIGHPAGFIEALANFYEDCFNDFDNHKNAKKEKITFGLSECEECILLLESISESSKNNTWVKLKK